MKNNRVLAEKVISYLQVQGLNSEKCEDIQWVCNRFYLLNIKARVLSNSQLNDIKKQINSIPTGRQKTLINALNQVLLYLMTVCSWELPEVKEQVFRDESAIWLLSIANKNCCATQCHEAYEAQRDFFMQQRWHDLGWVLLVLNFEVAPLHLSYWCSILSTPTSIEFFEGQFTLKVEHNKQIASYSGENSPSFTRYALPVFAYRVLQDFYSRHSLAPLTPKILLDAINNWVDNAPYFLSSMNTAEWLRTFQSFWFNKHIIPPEILRDLSDPLRHVATVIPTQPCANSAKNAHILYQSIWQQISIAEGVKEPLKKEAKWPHKKLIKYHMQSSNKIGKKPAIPDWEAQNVLPKLFFHYADELFIYGGLKQKNLPAKSIDRYTNFCKGLSPLSFNDANDPEKLHAWAHQEFKRLDEQTTPWHLFNFLRSVAHQELTDHLDLNQFQRPELPSFVDPFRLNVSQVHQVSELLLSSSRGTPMQRLFSSIAVFIGYYGMMRRGEVLRLRLGDIEQSHRNKQIFDITITNTPEGRTKNGKTRVVNIFMPESAAKLIRVLLKIKAGSDLSTPLLALGNESIFFRASNYIYPATQALKMLYGTEVRFHHLRHGGAELLYLQGLHILYQRQGSHLSNIIQDKATEAMLSHESCSARFEFWLEGRQFSEINLELLFDISSKQIGHASYATTRKHYLHGMDKIVPILTPARRQYSRAELRYLFNLPVGSNDISRILSTMAPGYASLSDKDKKQFIPVLPESQILHKLKSPQFKQELTALKQQQTLSVDPIDFTSIWINSLPNDYYDESTSTFQYFCKSLFTSLNNGLVDAKIIEQQWQQLARGNHLNFTAKERTALRTLGNPQIMEKKAQSRSAPDTLIIHFQCPCNQKILHAFKTLCHEGALKRYKAIFVLEQNRKSLKSNKFNMVKQQFLRKGDEARQHIIPTGNTQLTITLETLIPSTLLQQALEQYFTHLISQKG